MLSQIGILVVIVIALFLLARHCKKKINNKFRKYGSLWRDLLRVISINITFAQIGSSLPSVIVTYLATGRRRGAVTETELCYRYYGLTVRRFYAFDTTLFREYCVDTAIYRVTSIVSEEVAFYLLCPSEKYLDLV